MSGPISATFTATVIRAATITTSRSPSTQGSLSDCTAAPAAERALTSVATFTCWGIHSPDGQRGVIKLSKSQLSIMAKSS